MRRPGILGLAVLLAGAALQELRTYQPRFRSYRAAAPILSAPAPVLDPADRTQVPGAGGPEPPRIYLDTTMEPPSGRVIEVSPDGRFDVALKTLFRAMGLPAGGRLQAVLRAARPGDVIELSAGETFVGNFVLPAKAGTDWITIRSTAYDRLPPAGTRVSAHDARLMAKIVSPNTGPAIRTAAGAHHYRLMGIEVTTTSAANFGLIRLEAPKQASVTEIPTDIVVDRCYVHGPPTGDIRVGIVLNGARLAVIDSYLADLHDRHAEAQAIAGWNGPGPFKIVNNYLEGAGENVMFGGADPTVSGLVPADIEIRGNHFFKPLSWRVGDPSYAGIRWIVKNLFELKNARRVLVDGNLFEHNWVQGDQHGWAILFTVRNQGGRCAWCVIEDVTFTNNVVRHSTAGVQFLGRDDTHQSQQARRILIRNNLFTDIGGSDWAGDPYWTGTLFGMHDGAAEVVIDHNTALHTGSPIIAGASVSDHSRHVGFVFTDNVVAHNRYGVSGHGTLGDPVRTLATYFPYAVFEGNLIVGGTAREYPPGNTFPPSLDAAGLENHARGDYRLIPSGRYKRGGRNPGVDVAILRVALGPMASESLPPQ